MATLRADEIVNNVCERIEQYKREVKIVNTGTVFQVSDGITRIHGLDEVMESPPLTRKMVKQLIQGLIQAPTYKH